MASPAWLALIAQVPDVFNVTVPVLVTLQAAEAVENVTALVDPPPVALTLNDASVATLSASVPNPMVCAALPMAMVCVTVVAAL